MRETKIMIVMSKEIKIMIMRDSREIIGLVKGLQGDELSRIRK